MADFIESVFGQSRALKTLQRINSTNRLPQALLFHGDEGVGKFRSAIEFSKAINENSPNFNYISKSINNFNVPFIKFVFPLPRGKNETGEDDPIAKLSAKENQHIQEELNKKSQNNYYSLRIEKANNIKISSIRDIKKFISLDYSDIDYRVIIIQDAHLMNDEAQNALLKSLEEPPEGIIFILITHKPELLLTTIHSRCWSIKFDPLTNDDIKVILTENFGIDSELASAVSPFSDGSVNKALRLIEDNFNEIIEKTIIILRYSMGGYYHTALAAFNEILAGKNNNFEHIIAFILKWLTDIEKHKSIKKDYFFSNHLDTIDKFTNNFPDIKVNEVFSSINALYNKYQQKVNLNILILNVIFKLHTLVDRNKH